MHERAINIVHADDGAAFGARIGTWCVRRARADINVEKGGGKLRWPTEWPAC
jgi:hypothetical protein